MTAPAILGGAPSGSAIATQSWRAWGGRTALDTLARMRRIVRDDIKSPAVFALARRLAATVPQRDDVAQAEAIGRWVAAHTLFVRDPVGLELLLAPSLMIATIQQDGRAAGDCDDIAMLCAALALAIGIPALFVAEAYGAPARPGSLPPLEHVYAVVQTRAGLRRLDVQRPPDVPTIEPTRRLEFPV